MGKGVTLRVKIAFARNDISKGGMAGRDGMMKFTAGRHGDIEILGVGDDIPDRSGGTVDATADDLHLNALVKRDFGNLMRFSRPDNEAPSSCGKRGG